MTVPSTRTCLRLLVAALPLAGASSAGAQDISLRLTTALAGRPYQPTHIFFTAQGTEAFLNLSHVDGRCISTTSCSTNADCTTVFPGSLCAGSPLRCQVPVDILVGQAAVIEKVPFCEIAACAGVSFSECAGISCPPTQTYCGSPGNCHTCPAAEDLCLCDGGAMCEESDAALAPPDVALVDGFGDAANPNRWHLAGASIDPVPPDSRLVVGPGPALPEGASATLAGVRFHVVSGQPYVLFLKRAVDPRATWAECSPFSHLSLYLTSGAPRWCDRDEDGYANTDCADTNSHVYPGAPEINDGVNNQCPGDAGYGARDEISPVMGFLTAGDKTRLTWPAQGGATAYDVARSPYRDFHAGCRLNATTAPVWSDVEAPPSGGVFHYLVRAAAPNLGSWGLRSSGVERTVCTGCQTTGDACDDGNVCTSGDTCVGTTCASGPPPNCSDANACTADSCNPTTGACVHVPVSCDDGNPCTTDSCNTGSGCVHTNNSNACNDGSACTTGDVCQAGVCAGSIPGWANHLVISQIQVEGDGGTPAEDEFVEIYNPTSSPISLNGWSLQYKTSAMPPTYFVHAFGGAAGSVPAHGWFLVARSSYNGSVPADQINTTFPMAATVGNLFLVNDAITLSGSCPSSATVIDKVSYSGFCPEGGAASYPFPNDSLLRRPAGACGNGRDLNNNGADLLPQSPSTPRNRTSPPQP